ncbi:heparinase II/III family protein [Psychromonas sp. CNPT3]|uniref:heparinase II/III family protein n=1 Tax=Psychromonas sp. CNPT3 TaxID=314282 RepID=UPI00006E9CA9|nr:alginate lyase family protein [Psychromonas sp. CNPT3]AGH80212.1 heparinase II/III family protein [Psychromonas sp. CNPT3]
MQTVTWYFKRIQRMSAKEIYWRVGALQYRLQEHLRVKLNFPATAKFKEDHPKEAPFHVFYGDFSHYLTPWKAALCHKAEKVLQHQLSYFDLENKDHGSPIDWHKDHSTGQNSSLAPILYINYRDVSVNGDCKLIWEPNRHHQLVILARAYCATKDKKYALGVQAQLNSWLDANPYGHGMNWCNPLEIGIRLINWTWAIDLTRDADIFKGDFKKRVLNAIFLQCREIDCKFSQGSSANNHLVGETAGLYIASTYFCQFSLSARWQKRSKQILETQIVAQTYPDGGSKEHAFSYQFFVFQLYLFAAQVGKKVNDTFSDTFNSHLQQIALFIAGIAQGGKKYPMLGDQDDGYVLDLGDHVHNVSALCAIANHLSPHPLLQKNITSNPESAFWLFSKNIDAPLCKVAETLHSQAFKDSGYYLLQAGSMHELNQVSVLFDCAPLGYTAIAAHGHADALSFIVRLNGDDLLVDCGTYDYYRFPQWREHFCKTQSHNCIEIDRLDQSQRSGPFMWEKHAQSQCLLWEPNAAGGNVSASHNGYQRLASPLLHQRDISLDAQQKELHIHDILSTQGTHQVRLYLHFGEQCEHIKIEGNSCTLRLGDLSISLYFAEELQLSLIQGQENTDKQAPSLGWISRGYHQKSSITTLCASTSINSSTSFITRIKWQ